MSFNFELESDLLKRIRSTAPDATILIASSNITSAKNADRISLSFPSQLLINTCVVVVLWDGKITEYGTHFELLAKKGGKYRDMALRQVSLGEEGWWDYFWQIGKKYPPIFTSAAATVGGGGSTSAEPEVEEL